MAVPSLLLCLLLLVSPHLGCSYHTSYTRDGRHHVLRSNRDPRRRPKPTCSSAHSAHSAVPVVHRLSPCSPLAGAARNQQPERRSVADVLHRDALRLRSLLHREEDNHRTPAPAAPPGGGVSIPSRGEPIEELPGAFEYHVVAGFGTPMQKLPVGFDTTTTGATLLQCTPCGSGADHAFDPSASSSVSQVPCGSPDCPFHGCSGRPSCTLSVSFNNTLLGNATFFTDTLTLTPSSSATVDKFRFACLEGIAPGPAEDGSAGILDLSRNSHSLPSRLVASSPPHAVAFSYCLPASTADVGFLSLGATKPELLGRKVSYTPLRGSPSNGNLYVVDLVGLGLGGPDLPIPPAAIAGDDTILELHTTFTYLKPQVYAVLRDSFRKSMSEYPAAPPLGSLDTCYNFTGLDAFSVPAVTLKFAGGADVDLWMDEMMYFTDPDNHFSIGCLAFVAQDDDCDGGTVIGSMAQMSTEVVYDVRGGKVGFVPYRC